MQLDNKTHIIGGKPYLVYDGFVTKKEALRTSRDIRSGKWPMFMNSYRLPALPSRVVPNTGHNKDSYPWLVVFRDPNYGRKRRL